VNRDLFIFMMSAMSEAVYRIENDRANEGADILRNAQKRAYETYHTYSAEE